MCVIGIWNTMICFSNVFPAMLLRLFINSNKVSAYYFGFSMCTVYIYIYIKKLNFFFPCKFNSFLGVSMVLTRLPCLLALQGCHLSVGYLWYDFLVENLWSLSGSIRFLVCYELFIMSRCWIMLNAFSSLLRWSDGFSFLFCHCREGQG